MYKKRVLVCGGRDYDDKEAVFSVLDHIDGVHGIWVVIEGGAPGADTLARRWAHETGLMVNTYFAEWERYGKRAGYVRNALMLKKGKPDIVVAFPGGKGTDMMVRLAKKAGVEVMEIVR